MTQGEKFRQKLFPRLIHKTITNAAEHNVGKSAAALTYYLLFALFPLLIFVSNLLGLLDLDVASITKALMPIMPRDAVNLLEAYLYYVTDSSSHAMLWFSLVFTVWFPFRAVRSLMDDVRIAYGIGKPSRPIFYTIRQFLFTIFFLVIIIVLFLLATLGRKFVSTLTVWLGVEAVLDISPLFLNLWQYLRFVLLAVIMCAVLGLLYGVSQDKKQPTKTIMPGVVMAMTAWLVVSIGFSIYVENFANYSVIYGTLGAVIVLLIWLYMTAFILILGAEFNASLVTTRQELLDINEQQASIPGSYHT